MNYEFLSVVIALAAACVFGFNVFFQQRALRHIDAVPGAMLSVIAMALAFWISSPFWADYSLLWHPSLYIFVIIGLFFPALGQFLQIKSVSHVGPALTSILGTFAPLFASIPAVLFLGEVITLQMAFCKVSKIQSFLALSHLGSL